LKKTIEITIDTKGNSKVETKGFAGNECRQASEFIELALGRRTGEQLTAEFHQQARQQQVHRQGN
jgi:hypothetical protein